MTELKKPHFGNVTSDEKEAGVFQIALQYYENSDELHKFVPMDIKGRLHGIETVFRDNGHLWSTTPYVHGELHGVERFYNDAGQVYREVIYENGEKISEKQAYRHS